MKHIALILKELKGQHWLVIISLTLLGGSYLFKDDISKLFKGANKHVTNNFLESSKLVDAGLIDLMNSVGGDRAYIFRFHNGVGYNDGGHKKKMSNEYEVTRAGVSRQAQNLQDIPVSLFPEFISEVIKYDFVYADINLIKDSKTKSILKEQAINGVVIMPYYDAAGHLMAMIGVDWVFSKFPEAPDCDKFKQDVERIGRIIEYEKIN